MGKLLSANNTYKVNFAVEYYEAPKLFNINQIS